MKLVHRSIAMMALLAIPLASAAGQAPVPCVTHLRYVTILVRDYNEALAWYTNVLGLAKKEDHPLGAHGRWLVVAPPADSAVGIVLDVPHSDISRPDRIGKETNWVFEVADCMEFYQRLRKLGVHFLEIPTTQPWGAVQAIFEDPYGNIFVAESAHSAPTSGGASRQ